MDLPLRVLVLKYSHCFGGADHSINMSEWSTSKLVQTFLSINATHDHLVTMKYAGFSQSKTSLPLISQSDVVIFVYADRVI